jgi:hypothetical protein
MTDNAAADFVVDSLDPEDPEPPTDDVVQSLGEHPLASTADEGDAFEQSREVPVDDDEYPR